MQQMCHKTDCIVSLNTSSLKALEEPANSRVKRELGETLKALRALPKHQLSGPNTNGNGNGSEAQEGPAPLLARCRTLAMQVEVRVTGCLLAGRV